MYFLMTGRYVAEQDFQQKESRKITIKYLGHSLVVEVPVWVLNSQGITSWEA